MRLLLAEDEVELSNALTAILKHNNYSVEAVYNGQDAVDYALNDDYDGIILDIMMPIKDGITALKEIRQSGSDVPVLMLTAKSQVDDKVMGLDSGADDYITKPFATKELLARIRAMTRRKGEITESVLKFSDIELDRSSYELKSKTGNLRLANKEFQMLEMMMINPNIPISTEKFMEKIWGYDSEAEINVVWVYISNLRKKFSSLNSCVQIKASRNMGYLLGENHD